MLAIAVVCSLAGTGLFCIGLLGQAPTSPDPEAAGQIPPPITNRASAPEPREAPPPSPRLPAATPLAVRVPSIGLDTPLIRLGLNPDGTVQVPSGFNQAGWFTPGPSPGEIGAAVLLGHVDSYHGPAVFYRLGQLHPGDLILVAREDHTTAPFTVDAVRAYPKTGFPTTTVYGPIDYAGLRLITCGGPFDRTTRSYDDNIVVYAHLTPPPPASAPRGNRRVR